MESYGVREHAGVLDAAVLELARDPARLAMMRAVELRDAMSAEAYDRLTRTAQRLLAAQVVVCSLIDEDRLVFQSFVGVPEPWASRGERPLDMCFCGYVLTSPGPLAIDDTTLHAEFRDNPATTELGIRAYLGVPLVVRGHRVGAFAIMDVQPRTWTYDEIELASDLAAAVQAELELQLAAREAEAMRLQNEVVHELTQALGRAEPLEALYALALDSLERVLGVSRSALLLCDADGRMRFEAWRGLSDGYRATVDGHAPWPTDVEDPRPLVVTDVEADEPWATYRPLFRSERIRSFAFVPLCSNDRVIGTCVVYDAAPREFLRRDLRLAGTIAGHIAVAIALARSRAERERLVTELQQTVRCNEIFAGILAHDLRGPLGAIMGTAELMKRSPDARDELARPLDRIRSSGDRMRRMIEQLLDFTRLRVGGGISIHADDTDLRALCQQILAEIESANPSWTITLDVIGDVRGAWDHDRLGQVISNLAGNAVQHGDPAAGLAVRLDGSAADVELRVWNQGAIPAELRATLFDPFRGTRHRRGRSGGLGLGLFITQQIVAAHGGSIECRSSADDGTTFTVRLPRRARAHHAGELAHARGQRSTSDAGAHSLTVRKPVA